jgi:hypothetical protein
MLKETLYKHCERQSLGWTESPSCHSPNLSAALRGENETRFDPARPANDLGTWPGFISTEVFRLERNRRT